MTRPDQAMNARFFDCHCGARVFQPLTARCWVVFDAISGDPHSCSFTRAQEKIEAATPVLAEPKEARAPSRPARRVVAIPSQVPC